MFFFYFDTQKEQDFVDNLLKKIDEYNHQGYLSLAATAFFSLYSSSDYCDLHSYLSPYILNDNFPHFEDLKALLSNNPKKIIEYCLDRAGSRSDTMRGYFHTPSELRNLMVKLGDYNNLSEDSIIYNPFAGIGDFSDCLQHINYYGEEEYVRNHAFASMRQVLRGSTGEVKLAKPIERVHIKNRVFDGMISAPYLSRTGKTDIELYDFLFTSSIVNVKDGGKSICLLPLSIARLNRYKKIRQSVLGQRNLKMIISLPRLKHQLGEWAIFVFENCSHDSILMVDGKTFVEKEDSIGSRNLKGEELFNSICKEEKEFCRNISYDDLKGIPEHVMIPSLYVLYGLEEGYETISLDKLCEVIPKVKKKGTYEYRLPDKALSTNYLDCEISLDKLELISSRYDNFRYVKDDTYILNITSNGELRIGHIQNIPEDYDIRVSRYNMLLKFKDDQQYMGEKYFVKMLFTTYVRKQIEALVSGTIIPSLNVTDLALIKIPYNPIKLLQDQEIQKDMEALVQDSEKKLSDAFNFYKKEVRSRKHAISQNLSAFSALWNKLNNYCQRVDSITMDDKISKISSMSVKQAFDTLSNRLETLLVQTEHLSDVENDWGESEYIDPEEFLYEYSRSFPDTRFTYHMPNYPRPVLEEDLAVRVGRIKIPKRALTRVLDNIISNAVSHGFTNPERSDYKVLLSTVLHLSGNEIESVDIYIANNGAPLKEGFDPNDVFVYGQSTELYKTYEIREGQEGIHSGIGGSDIESILRAFDASVSFVSNPEQEFPVAYKLTFNNVKEYGQ